MNRTHPFTMHNSSERDRIIWICFGILVTAPGSMFRLGQKADEWSFTHPTCSLCSSAVTSRTERMLKEKYYNIWRYESDTVLSEGFGYSKYCAGAHEVGPLWSYISVFGGSKFITKYFCIFSWDFRVKPIQIAVIFHLLLTWILLSCKRCANSLVAKFYSL